MNDNPNSKRFLRRDGSLNIDSSSYQRALFRDLYHALLSMRWSRLLSLVGVAYFGINLLFGAAYFLAGNGALDGIGNTDSWRRFVDCFFFSVQTLATIGYGKISPVSLLAHGLVSVEALAGLLGLAMVTGIVFSRFSRPTARVVFSDKALISSLGGQPSLTFRIANSRLNQIVEARIRVVLARNETTSEGLTFRELYDLKLERDMSPLFSMTWTVVHPIDSESPLKGITSELLAQSETELLVTLTGIDETFLQSVYSRFSYAVEDLVWNAQFSDMISQTSEGRVHIDIKAINDITINTVRVQGHGDAASQ